MEEKIARLSDDELIQHYAEARVHETHLRNKLGNANYQKATIAVERELESRDLYPWGEMQPVSRAMRLERRGAR